MFYRLRRIRRLLQVGWNKEYLYSRDLSSRVDEQTNQIGEIRLISGVEMNLLQDIWKVNESQIKARFQRGDLCYCCFVDGVIASYHWVQYSGKHFLQQAGKYYDVKPHEGWIFHVRVAHWARGRGINAMVYNKILTDAKEMGKTQLWVYTNAKNTANQKGLLECGFKHVRTLTSIQLGWRYFLIGAR